MDAIAQLFIPGKRATETRKDKESKAAVLEVRIQEKDTKMNNQTARHKPYLKQNLDTA